MPPDPAGTPVLGHQAAVTPQQLSAAASREGWRVHGQPVGLVGVPASMLFVAVWEGVSPTSLC